MPQSPFGRVLSEREVEHRRRMLAHMTSLGGTAPVEPPPASHPPASAPERGEDSLQWGRVLPFSPAAKT